MYGVIPGRGTRNWHAPPVVGAGVGATPEVGAGVDSQRAPEKPAAHRHVNTFDLSTRWSASSDSLSGAGVCHEGSEPVIDNFVNHAQCAMSLRELAHLRWPWGTQLPPFLQGFA